MVIMNKSYLKTKQTKNSFGLFTEAVIPARTPIIELTGTIWNDDTLPEHQDQELILQIGPGVYLGPSGGLDDYINHSCEPNCYINVVGKRAILYSLYLIESNSELTFDYSLSSTDTYDTWTFNCDCGSFKCRKKISGYQYLSDELKEEYVKKGIVPLFINDPRFMRKE